MSKEKNDLEIVLYRPDEIKSYLDQYIIGQDEAKKTLSVAVYNHYKRIIHNYDKTRSDVEIEKSNCLICGPTGSGKTAMIKAIAKLLGVGCYIQDLTKVTQAGFVGSDVEECLVGLLRSCDYDIQKAQVSIVILDEADKVAKREAGPSITRDVSGEGVQQSLLKMIEGDVVGVPPAGGRKHPEQALLYIDTTNILFVGIGAFVGLDNIVKKRIGDNRIGFNMENTNLSDCDYYKYVTPGDLRDFGFIPEFVGRFPIITSVEKLSVDDLVKILNEPKNSLVKQYTELIAMDGGKLEFEKEALYEIAKEAAELETGARGLRSIIERVMSDIMYEAPKMIDEGKTTITITKEIVKEKINKKKYKEAV
jgi:ATP-dependent Clp protease ATP-binding subunit ClpX